MVRLTCAEDHKTYAGLEKALTKAVNAVASFGKTADISFKSRGTVYSFSISGTSVAQNLAGRIISVEPSESGAMYTNAIRPMLNSLAYSLGARSLEMLRGRRRLIFYTKGFIEVVRSGALSDGAGCYR
ncbi:hypothetical protein GCM10010981_32030 [Dyella nitratireducens]|uniref:Uncharacterized protein n=1 Tax=Dyella nitratireducens TaxID=1849580 RepID=A0ABQ1GBC9_9GAMM|nr:hypothetical protein GCM10010981_32030 [Dyella nitratireducens]GLQ40561.1 hypothetical protein GCM10007902_04100 [Dyella nitratireducens]